MTFMTVSTDHGQRLARDAAAFIVQRECSTLYVYEATTRQVSTIVARDIMTSNVPVSKCVVVVLTKYLQ